MKSLSFVIIMRSRPLTRPSATLSPQRGERGNECWIEHGEGFEA
jgi:hypothetical protein